MEKRYTEYGSQSVLDENILPYVIKVEQSLCSICGNNHKSLCCKGCSEVGQIQVLHQLVAVESSASKIFPGAISGFLKLKVVELQNSIVDLKRIEVRASKAAENIQRKAQLITEISHTRERLQALHQLQQLQQDNVNLLVRDESIIRDNIEQLRRRISRVIQKRAKITEYISTKKKVVSKSNESLMLTAQNLERIRTDQVRDLTTYIFPLVGIQQDEDYDDSEHSDEAGQPSSINLIEEELAEARRLSFVHGRWIYDQREGPDIIRISITSNKVSAPVDGNYAVCEAWLKSLSQMATNISEHPESGMQISETHTTNGASIYAALCFCTHLMHILRKILGIHLPYKILRRSFSNPHITVQEFLWNVHKLNGNVLAFCLLYGVDSQLIHPLHTLSNMQNGIQMCLHNSESHSSFPLSMELVTSLQAALDESSDPIPDDEEDKLEESLSEWELAVHEEDWDSLLPLEPTSPNQYVSASPFQSQAHDLMEQSQGLVSSAIAWISKGWWNK